MVKKIKFLLFLLLFFPASLFSLKFVVLSPEVTEIMFAIGAGKSIVGNTIYCDYPEEAKKIYKVGDFLNPDVEKIVKLNPDYVFLTSGVQTKLLLTFKRLNIKYLVVTSNNVEQLLKNIKLIGKITGKKKESEKLVKVIKETVENIRIKSKRMKYHPLVLPLLWHRPVYTAGRNTILNDIIRIAGGRNIGAKAGKGYFIIDNEFLLKNTPDIVIILDKKIPVNKVKRLRWVRKNTKIIKDINPDLLLRAGPRIKEGIKQLYGEFKNYRRTNKN